MTTDHTIEQLAQDNYDDAEAEAQIERFHAGYDAHKRGEPCPSEKDAADGWNARDHACHTVVVMPSRPEGYYHLPLGTFD